MQLIKKNISVATLQHMAEKMLGRLVKAVVDIEKEIMVVDAELHADQELFLLEDDSKQTNLWGINIYPAQAKQEGWIEFDSMINLRPSFGNTTRGVDDPHIQKKIVEIVNKLVTE